MAQQNIQAAMFEFITVDEVASKHNATELLPACTYTTPAIPMFGEPCANSLVTQSHTLTHPAIKTAEITNYKMIGGCAFPIIDDKCVKPQLFNANDWETWEQAKGFCKIQDNYIAYRGFTGHFKHNEKVINLCGNGSFNYAHWMTEYLPQLLLLKMQGVILNNYKVLIAIESFESMVVALEMLGIQRENIQKVPTFSFNEFVQGLWISPVANIVFQRPNALKGGANTIAEPNHAVFHPEVIKATAQFYKQFVTAAEQEKQPELIYISRTPGRTKNQRTVLNENSIIKELESQGFVCIDPSKMTFNEQIVKFSNAKIIVAPSGAALLNMLWAPSGAKIVVMMNDSKVANYWYFSNIAFTLGHSLSYVLGKAFDTGNWTDINHADFVINVDELLKSINKTSKSSFKIISKKIGFIIHEPALISHYKDVWAKLNKSTFSVVLTESFKKNNSKSNIDIEAYLNNNQIEMVDYFSAISQDVLFEYAVSNHAIHKFRNKYLPQVIGKKQIRFMCGADIGDGWSLQPWNEMYDYFLCHGVNDQKAIESRFKGKTFIMGYPRYDSFFDPDLDTQSIKDEFNLDTTKKTILWMPTLGGDYSSIPRYAEKLKNLISQYNFIIRPHPISFVQEPEFIALLERCGYLIDRNAIRDMNALYKVSDLVLTDNGGSPFSAIFMGKNVVFLDVPEDLGDNPNSHHIVNTSVYTLKKHLPVIKENDTQRLEQLLNSDDFYKENSKIVEEMFKKFFDCPRGGGAQRVADILNSLE